MTTFEQVVAHLDGKQAVSVRMRAIFGLKGLNTEASIRALEQALRTDPSALVRHEIAYVLGQMGAHAAIPSLQVCLCDEGEDVMVRHEAAEAMGAIGCPSVLPLLERFGNDRSVALEIRETCTVAIAKINESSRREDASAISSDNSGQNAPSVVYNTVDPAPPTTAVQSVCALREVLCDSSRGLYERYGALFALRNRGGDEATLALCAAMESERDSALFRHEVAYVLGQMGSSVSIGALGRVLGRRDESEMVRHEAAEALGAIGGREAEGILGEFRGDATDVVRESVEVALDISEHVGSDQVHYADTLGVV